MPSSTGSFLTMFANALGQNMPAALVTRGEAIVTGL